MSGKGHRDLQIIIASGPKDLSRAVLGFAFGASASVSAIRVKIVLALDGLGWIQEKEPAAKQGVNGFSSIEEYMKILAENGASISVCSACLNNACPSEKEDDPALAATGLTELAVKSCNAGVSTVVF